MLPKSFRPCREPFSKDSRLGTRSGRPERVRGRFQMSQWAKVPPGASGSSQMRARARAAAGMPDQARAGETSAPEHAYFVGIVAPLEKTGEEIFKGIEWSSWRSL